MTTVASSWVVASVAPGPVCTGASLTPATSIASVYSEPLIGFSCTRKSRLTLPVKSAAGTKRSLPAVTSATSIHQPVRPEPCTASGASATACQSGEPALPWSNCSVPLAGRPVMMTQCSRPFSGSL